MSINVYNIEQAILDKMNTASTELELLEYSKMLTELKTGIVQVVSTFASLPTAATAVGHLYYVQDEKTIYWANAANGWNLLRTPRALELYAWGDNLVGQLGVNDITRKSSPVQEITTGNNWCSVDLGLCHTLGLKTNNTLWTWGRNFHGQLGHSAIQNRSSPIQECSLSTNWCMVKGGGSGSAALKSGGTAWLWGRNTYGHIGDNSVVCASSPVQEITSSTNWCMITLGNYHAAALKTTGQLWAWGYNGLGQLGYNSIADTSSPVQEMTSSTNWCLVMSNGGNSVIALKTTGQFWAWGDNGCGQLGHNLIACTSSPVQEITSSTDWCTAAGGNPHTIAIKTNGTVWAWGSNCCGQLGHNSIACTSSPVQEITSSTNWCNVSTGNRLTAAINTTGQLWLWGNGLLGGLGNNSAVQASSPVQEITSSTNWYTVSQGVNSTAALKTFAEL